MNVLFLTLLNFKSLQESNIYTDLMREFVKAGHYVCVVSPTERKHFEKNQLISEDTYRILKLQIGNNQKTSMLEKGISYLTLESKFLWGIKKYFSDLKFELVLYSTPPITLQRPVEYVKKRDDAKAYLLLKDIFPQNAIDLRLLKKTGFWSVPYWYFRNKERQIYEKSDYIGCMSPANVDFILRNNPSIPPKCVEICPNSIEPSTKERSSIDVIGIRQKYQIPNNKTVFIYGGNIGKPQGIDFLIECLESNKYNEKVYFVIVGSGTEFAKIQRHIKFKKLLNVRLIQQLLQGEYQQLVYACDVGLIFLDRKFTIPNFPSRLLSYMDAGMPILAATDVNGDLGSTIETGKFGYWCESVDVEMFNQCVSKLCDPEKRRAMGKNARRYLEAHFTAKHSYDIIMNHFK